MPFAGHFHSLFRRLNVLGMLLNYNALDGGDIEEALT